MRDKCKWVLSLCAVLAVLVLTSSVALGADDYRILWGPNPVPGPAEGGGGGGHPIDGYTGGNSSGASSSSSDVQYNGAIVYARTKYDAALLVCGYSLNDSRLTDDVRIQLKTERFGGAFLTLARYFSDLQSSDGSAYRVPDFYGNDTNNSMMLRGVCASATSLYGAQNVFAGLYTDGELTLAKAAVESLLDGSGGGSGGIGGGTVDGDLTFGGVSYKIFNTVDVPAGLQQLQRQSAGVAVSVAYLNAMTAYLGENDIDGAQLFIGVNDNPSWPSVSVAAVGVCPEFGTFEGVTSYKFLKWPDFPALSGVNLNSVSSVGYANQGMYVPSTTVDGKKYWLMNPHISKATVINGNANVWDAARPCYSYYYGGLDGSGESGGGSVEDPDPDPEPDPPATPKPTLPEPDPPSLPNPPDNPVVEPDPPNVPTPKDPVTPTVPTVQPDTNTYTPDISGILDALDEHCQHLQAKMVDCSEYIVDSFGDALGGFQNDLFDYMHECVVYLAEAFNGVQGDDGNDVDRIGYWVSWLAEGVHADFGYLLDYLNALWDWLENSFVIDFTGVGSGYDDSSLIGWLEKIYVKLGDGFNFTPRDPVTNPNETSNWLEQFLASFFGSLLANLAGALAEAGGALATLATKFPFCIPWDIMAILGLLASPPVCPVIELPCYSLTSSGLQQVGSYVIDLHDIEFAVEGIRWMMKLGFILVLANRTKDWLEMLEGVMG